MKYIVLVKAKKKEEEEETEEEEREEPEREGEEETEEEGEVKVGDTILIPGTEKEVEVVAVGRDGITAKDEEDNKYLIRNESVKEEKEKENPGEDEEDKEKEDISIPLEEKVAKKEKGEEKGGEEEEVSIKDFLKKEFKEGDWIQAISLSKLLDMSVKEVTKELKKLEEVGFIQYVADNKWGDILYKYTGAERSKDEAKPNKYETFKRQEAKGEEESGKKEDPVISEFKRLSGWKFDDSWVVPDPKHDEVYLIFVRSGEKKYRAAIFYREDEEVEEVEFKEAAEKHAPKELKAQMGGKKKEKKEKKSPSDRAKMAEVEPSRRNQ